MCDGVAPFADGDAGNEWQRNRPARHFVILCCGQSIEQLRAFRTENKGSFNTNITTNLLEIREKQRC